MIVDIFMICIICFYGLCLLACGVTAVWAVIKIQCTKKRISKTIRKEMDREKGVDKN